MIAEAASPISMNNTLEFEILPLVKPTGFREYWHAPGWLVQMAFVMKSRRELNLLPASRPSAFALATLFHEMGVTSKVVDRGMISASISQPIKNAAGLGMVCRVGCEVAGWSASPSRQLVTLEPVRTVLLGCAMVTAKP